MVFILRICLSFILASVYINAKGQEPFYAVQDIPLGSDVNINLTGRDTAALDYYNLYAFQYKSSTGTVQAARFMVPKDLDIYRQKKQVTVKLCRLTTFINSWQGTEGEPIQVEDFVEITSTYGKPKKLHFNLDPEMPDPVYTICGTQKPVRNKN